MIELGNIKDAAAAVEGITKAVPIYQDLLQPTVQELGKGIHTLSKTIHIALTPVSALVWGYDKIKDFIQESLEKKLEKVPKENIIPPAPEVAVPVIEALRYTGHREELREMFSNLLAKSMIKDESKLAHPAFVEIIKQLSPDEAKIFELYSDGMAKPIIKIRMNDKNSINYIEPVKEFSIMPFISKCEHPDLGPSYLNNLARLGLINFTYNSYTIAENSYEPLYDHPLVKYWKEHIESLGKTCTIYRGASERTSFGKQFTDACII